MERASLSATEQQTDGGGADSHVVIMGAGPAGLTAAWELTGAGTDVDVLEADAVVGGIARTASYKGYRFDIGGHRFFTKAPEVSRVWHEILDEDDWLHVPRMSRIFYRGKFFDYPLRAFDALSKLGVLNSALCVASYARARGFPRKEERSFEDWIINHFGQRLYRIFFKTYTEKVWGMPCSEISADWAAQRIKGLSLTEAVRNALRNGNGNGNGGGRNRGGEVIKTLIDRFEYPRLGPGMMWERATEIITKRGGRVHLETPVTGIRHAGGRVTEVLTSAGDVSLSFRGSDYISTLPIRELVTMLDPAPPEEVRRAAAGLRYRDFLTVVLVVDREHLFPDNWIYVHDPSVALGRVQNFKNWSPHMVPDPSHTALGLEYFCNIGDQMWELGDDQLIALGAREVAQIGLCREDEIFDGTVVRMPKAYPVYDDDYKERVAVVRRWAEANLANLQLVGRNGMHKYNNQDHAMMAALLAARNILGEHWDPWKVNTDAEYHEEAVGDGDAAGRGVPRRVGAGR